jgi:hypothetical protein
MARDFFFLNGYEIDESIGFKRDIVSYRKSSYLGDIQRIGFLLSVEWGWN